jgi:hypothetical protein
MLKEGMYDVWWTNREGGVKLEDDDSRKQKVLVVLCMTELLSIQVYQVITADDTIACSNRE